MARAKNAKKLTPGMLRKMVLEEKTKLRRSKLRESDPIVAGLDDVEKVSADEVEADELAGTLEKELDHLKVLKVQERKVRSRLRKIAEARRRVSKRIKRKLQEKVNAVPQTRNSKPSSYRQSIR